MKVTVILNYKNEKNANLAAKIGEYLLERGAELFLPKERPGFSPEDCKEGDLAAIDIALVLGGDGTILAAARHLTEYGVPILGVNMGKMGFLSEVEEKNVFSALDRLLAGDYQIEQRMALEGSILREGRPLMRAIALNDFSLNNGVFARTIDFEVSLNNEYICDYRADGVIIATPTGSTAYAFSAGGPLVMPEMDLFLLAPICPHNVFSRALILPSRETVNIVFRSPSDTASFVADGQLHFSLKRNDLIQIKALDKKARLVRFNDFPFFARVKKKIYQQQ